MPPPSARIDPRGPRFGAALTTGVLAVGLVTASPWVLAVQTAVFAVGALLGVTATPYAVAYKALVRPRLGPPAELEDAAPPRFAQAVGLVFALVATVGFAAGLTVVGTVATAAALAAAFLNAAFGFCLGCEVYLIVRRASGRTSVPAAPHVSTVNQNPSAAALAATKEVPA